MKSREIAPAPDKSIRSWWQVLLVVIIGFSICLLIQANIAAWFDYFSGSD